MRLPTANPARGVQRLGREDIRAPQRVASMEARLAGYEGQGLKLLGAKAQEVGDWLQKRQDAEEALEYQQAIAEGEGAMDAQVGLLKSQPMLRVQDHPGLKSIDWTRTETVRGPDGAPIERERTVVPADEVSIDLFDHAMEQERTARRANISGARAKAKFDIEWEKLYQDRRNDLLVKNIERRRKRQAIQAETVIDTHIQQGNYDKAREAHAQATFSGLFSVERAASTRRRIDRDISMHAATVAFDSARTDDALAQFRQDVMDTAQLSATDKASWLSKADARENTLRTRRKEEGRKAAARIESEALEAQMTDGVEYTEDDARATAAQLRRIGQPEAATRTLKTFQTVRRSQRQERETTPRDVRASFQGAIADVAFPPEGSSTREEAVKVRRTLREALAEGVIDDKDYRRFIEDLEGAAQSNYNTEEYRATKRNLWVELTGLSEDQALEQLARLSRETGESARKARERLALLSRAAIRADEDLREHMQTKGAEADPEAWWTRRQDAYDPVTTAGNSKAAWLARHPEYLPPEGGEAVSKEVIERIRLDPNIGERERRLRIIEYQRASEGQM